MNVVANKVFQTDLWRRNFDVGMACFDIRTTYLDYAYFFCVLPFGTLVPVKDHPDGCELSVSTEDPVNFLENYFEQTLFPQAWILLLIKKPEIINKYHFIII